MNIKQPACMHHPRLACHPALLVAGLLAALPGSVSATLFSPSVEASIASSTTSAASGPVSLTYSGTNRSGAAWTDYGINRASSSIIGTGPSSGFYSGTLNVKSKWTDRLTVNTLAVASGAPISFLFSFRLDGSLAAHEADNTGVYAEVKFRTEHTGIDGIYGVLYAPNFTAVAAPTPNSTGGGDASLVIDEILYGNYTIHNGEVFNLVAVLEANTQFGFFGPPGFISAESLFGNSAEWLGASVQVDGNSVPFTITSGSGHDYTAAVPEPAKFLLFGSGLAVIGGAAWRRNRRKASEIFPDGNSDA